jgi:hypothetical protein
MHRADPNHSRLARLFIIILGHEVKASCKSLLTFKAFLHPSVDVLVPSTLLGVDGKMQRNRRASKVRPSTVNGAFADLLYEIGSLSNCDCCGSLTLSTMKHRGVLTTSKEDWLLASNTILERLLLESQFTLTTVQHFHLLSKSLLFPFQKLLHASDLFQAPSCCKP